MMMELTISKAAGKAGVGIETVRFYERNGLIEQPPKPEVGYRTYPLETIRRIRFIRQAQELGFSLREAGDLLSLHADPATDCSDVRERAQVKLDDVEDRIAKLGQVRTALTQLIDACPGSGALRSCSIMDALTDWSEA